MSVFSKSFPIKGGSRVFQLEENGKFNVHEIDAERGTITTSLRASSVGAANRFLEHFTAALKELQETMPHLCPKEPEDKPVQRKISIP